MNMFEYVSKIIPELQSVIFSTYYTFFSSNKLIFLVESCQVLIYIRVFMSLIIKLFILLGVLILINNGTPK